MQRITHFDHRRKSAQKRLHKKSVEFGVPQLTKARSAPIANCTPPGCNVWPDFLPLENHYEATCGVIRDVAPLESAIQQLKLELAAKNSELQLSEKARQKAVRALQTRGAFVANLSHELRTPLNAILGFSEVISRELFGPLGNERYREYGEIIHKSGSHLLNLINDVLDIAKLDAGKLEMHFDVLDLSQIVLECVQVVEPLARRAQVEIHVELADNARTVEADDKRLRQMLLNLLSNAIKFTRFGGKVSVFSCLQDDRINIAVADTGIGIAASDLSRVLEPFAQVDSDLGRKHVGTGLGLPLVKKLAELHRGHLTIESVVGVGSTVTLAIPLRRDVKTNLSH